jgi:hypothetical protein
MSVIDWLSETSLSACGVESFGDAGAAASTLDWMEQSALGLCVSSSHSGYYLMLGFHSLGLAMLVGALMVVDLRILKVVRGIPAEALPKLVWLGWWGFWINAVSGVAVFFSEANKMFYDNTFRWKLSLIAIGVVSTLVLSRTVLVPAAARGAALLDGSSARIQASFSLLLWIAVIIVGRMIAYLAKV